METNGPLIGKKLTCAETGKEFTGAAEGCSVNYARDSEGRIFSDEGVNLRELRDMLDHSKPFYAYVSCDGKNITGWKGNILGTIISANKSRLTRQSFTHGAFINHYVVRDAHGALWYGKGNPGICVPLRAYKTK